MNEGHAALLTLDRLAEARAATGGDGLAEARKQCVFTTHTPVPAGQDRFPYDLYARTAPELVPLDTVKELAGPDELNMTRLALNLSGYSNAVAERHAETTRHMFPGHEIHAVTNGVHTLTWAHKEMARALRRPCAELAARPEGAGRHRLGAGRGHLDGAPQGQGGAGRAGLRAHRHRARPRQADPRLCPAHDALQAAAADVQRHRAAGRDRPALAAADRHLRQGPSARRRRPRGHPPHPRDRRPARRAAARRLRAGLQHARRQDDRRRRRRVGEHADAADGSLGHQRHEGGAQRRSQFQRARRLVGGRLPGRRQRLGDRRRRRRQLRRRPCRRLLRQARRHRAAALPRRPQPAGAR